ncbi:MAG TPA: hypothetical protein IGS17_11815 [Oscillatoriales cyanobacterium M59_W2019_021]|nr:hypothetical protein [Oscillatoriales cyanobacterium M59_W2019_021]
MDAISEVVGLALKQTGNSTVSNGGDRSTMGLREKRLIHRLHAEVLPKYEAALRQETGGGAIEWQVNWDSFSNCDEEALERLERFGLRKISEAIESICIDDFGRKAVRDGLKMIYIQQVDDSSQVAVAMDEDTLKVFLNCADFYHGYVSEFKIQEVLENGL